jgi:hypothetical protein
MVAAVGSDDDFDGVTLHLASSDPEHSTTTTVIRTFRPDIGEFALDERFDWDTSNPGIDNDELRKLKKNFPAKVEAIVVYDHDKGVVTWELIRALAKKYRNAKWFVGSKVFFDPQSDVNRGALRELKATSGRLSTEHVHANRKEAHWMVYLQYAGIRPSLVFFPSPAADTATVHLDPSRPPAAEGNVARVRTWIHRKGRGRITRKALKAVLRVWDAFGFDSESNSAVVVLPDCEYLLAKHAPAGAQRRGGDNREPNPQSHSSKEGASSEGPTADSSQAVGASFDGIIADSESSRVADGLPRSAIAFGAIIHEALSGNADWAGRLLEVSKQTECWRRNEAKRITDPEHWTTHQTYGNAVIGGNDTRDSLSQLVRQFNWNEEMGVGKEAFTAANYGIIESGKDRRLELWRAQTEVLGYYCCVRNKRVAIQQLLDQIKLFVNEEKQRHRSCFVYGEPGAGKTALAKKLAENNDLIFVTINITHLTDRRDLLGHFDGIVTQQAENRDPKRSCLVFVDEINAKISSQHVYDAFLSPIDSGVYERGGLSFLMEPCFWLFAGTESLHADPDPNNPADRSDKASDLRSRLAIPELELRTPPTDGSRLERVYVGAHSLMHQFRDVEWISDWVLAAFASLKPEVTMREFNTLLRDFHNISGRTVTRSNATRSFENRLVQIPDESLDKRLVRIVAN